MKIILTTIAFGLMAVALYLCFMAMHYWMGMIVGMGDPVKSMLCMLGAFMLLETARQIAIAIH